MHLVEWSFYLRPVVIPFASIALSDLLLQSAALSAQKGFRGSRSAAHSRGDGAFAREVGDCPIKANPRNFLGESASNRCKWSCNHGNWGPAEM